jgi:arylsulfatase A-like enzyme
MLTLFACVDTPPASAPPPAPAPAATLDAPVVLVTIDTWRADGGGANRPTLDALSAEGVAFDQAFSATNSTGPSHTSLLTGLPAHVHGVSKNGYRLALNWRTLGERLRERKYRSGAFVSVSHLAAATCGLDQGFDHYEDAGAEEELAANVTIDRAVAWLDGVPAGPFLLWVHLFEPHAPYVPPGPWDTAYYQGDPRAPGTPILSLPWRGRVPFNPRLDAWLDGVTDMAWPATQYQGEVSYADAQLGRLVEALRSRDRWDRSLVVVTGDHGESLGERGVYFAHQGLAEANFHVPLVMKLPGGALAGTRTSALATHTDLVPTVLAAVGLPQPPQLPGLDLRAIASRAVRHEAVFAESGYPDGGVMRGTKWRLELAREALGSIAAGTELHEGGADATVDDAAVTRAMSAALVAWMAQGNPGAARPAPPDAATLEQLRALGYAQ